MIRLGLSRAHSIPWVEWARGSISGDPGMIRVELDSTKRRLGSRRITKPKLKSTRIKLRLSGV